MSQNITDEWNIGTLHKQSIWIFYILMNYIGVILCLTLIIHICKNVKRTTYDIFVIGLLSGCLSMSITCGTQCVLNTIAQRFYGGKIACQVEAIAHVSSIVTEFVCVSCISLNMYRNIICKKAFQKITAWISIIIIWFICTGVTILLSLVSPIYLMSAGTYCFFDFSSYAVAAWLAPMLIISLFTMLFCHFQIMKHFKTMLAKPNLQQSKIHVVTFETIVIQQFRWRSTWFMITLFFGLIFAVISCIFEFVQHQTPEWMVTATATGGVSFSVFAPLVFLFTLRSNNNEKQICCYLPQKKKIITQDDQS